MKYIRTLSENISYNNKPQKKYPVGKCLDFLTVDNELREMHNIDITEVNVNDAESKRGSENFYSWFSEIQDPLFPKPSLSNIMHQEKKSKYAKFGMDIKEYRYCEKEAIYELPISYDSTGDEQKWKDKVEKFKKDIEATTGKKISDSNLKSVNFGSKSNDWVNIVLNKIHELYPQYYKNGKIQIWHDEYEFDKEKQIYDYPYDKCYFLSELEHWLEDTFDIDVSEFHDWVLNCQYIEGRHWQRVWEYDMEDINFRKHEASESIKKINEVFRQLYKDEEVMPIFIDYYKKYTEVD